MVWTHPKKEGRELIAWATHERGWSLVGKPTRYAKLACPCGDHMTWVHISPSNPNYWRERRQHIERVCPGVDVEDPG